MSVSILIKDLVQNYGGQTGVLKGINLEIRKGEFIAIIGQNGAGKTTLVKHLNGLLRPDSGCIYIDGRDISSLTTAQLSQKVGYVFQNPDHQIFMDRVDKEIAFGPNNLGLTVEEISQRVNKALEKVGLMDIRGESPLSLSKGQRQRVAFASILAMEPEFLILDEPTTGQDARETAEIMELVVGLNQKGHTIIFITHDMQLVATYAKRVILMKQGRILADGAPKEVLPKTSLLNETYLKPPQITLLAQAFSSYGFPKDIISVKEFLEAYELINTPNQELLTDAG